ncbi:MAG TPA: hypothetical protein PKJ41_17270 [Bryobacteraceae bacterium]|nr:hypothetical protein [Bryobacteraceae bacterium]HPT25719.1 hypothetical protein [Bryobacteraceae bacterium]
MVSPKLIQLLETHWEAVSARFFRLLNNEPGLVHLKKLPESELSHICRRLVSNIGQYLMSKPGVGVSIEFERVGRERFQEGVVLSEAIRGVQLLKEAAISYLRDQELFDTSVDIYAEEELEHQIGIFFDLLVVNLACGYEKEQARAATV